MNPLIKPAKAALAKKYGYKNVAVRNGQGTAWGWVEVKISAPKPKVDCRKNYGGECGGYGLCMACRDAQHAITNEARQIIHKAWQVVGLKPYTYTSDDGYGSERGCVLIDVTYA